MAELAMKTALRQEHGARERGEYGEVVRGRLRMRPSAGGDVEGVAKMGKGFVCERVGGEEIVRVEGDVDGEVVRRGAVEVGSVEGVVVRIRKREIVGHSAGVETLGLEIFERERGLWAE